MHIRQSTDEGYKLMSSAFSRLNMSQTAVSLKVGVRTLTELAALHSFSIMLSFTALRSHARMYRWPNAGLHQSPSLLEADVALSMHLT